MTTIKKNNYFLNFFTTGNGTILSEWSFVVDDALGIESGNNVVEDDDDDDWDRIFDVNCTLIVEDSDIVVVGNCDELYLSTHLQFRFDP